MATFGEIVYMCLDILKENSDDSFYTEEHILFLAKKMRALLLERKYRGSRNQAFTQMSEENRQQVCLQVVPAQNISSACNGKWLMSTAVVPELLTVEQAVTCTGHDLLPTNVTFISRERMPYVGYNKWLQKIIYAARSIDGHLYLRSANPQFAFLSMVGVTGVFSDPEAAANLCHEVVASGQSACEDIMNQRFPLEASLVPICVEMVVQELIGSRYAPKDDKNNAHDDLGDAAVTQNRPSNAAKRTAEQQDEEEQ